MADPLSETALSDREKDVLALAGDGLTDKEIALQLSIATKTVRTYWDRMRQKMNASSRAQVIAKAFRQTYDLLREGEETYRKLLDLCQEGVWLLDSEGRTSFTSEKMAAILGYMADDLHGKQVSEFVPAEEADKFNRLLTAAELGPGKQTFDTKLVRRDGASVSLIVQASPRIDRKGLPIGTLLVVTDVSERDSLISQYDHRFWAIVEAATDPIARFSPDLKCTYVNPALAEAAEGTTDAFLGRHLAELDSYFQPTDAWRKGIEEAMATKEITSQVIAGSTTVFVPELDHQPDPVSVFSLIRVQR